MNMAKSSKKQIDQDEKRVIEQLQRNSNESIDKIAKTCGFSRQKVWRIIKRLENNKTIWGYTAIPDKDKQGVRHYILLLKRSNQPAGDIVDNVLDAFKKYTGKNIGVFVQTASVLQGEYDLCSASLQKISRSQHASSSYSKRNTPPTLAIFP